MIPFNFDASKKLDEFKQLLQANENISTNGLWDSTKAVVALLAREATHKNIVIITSGSTESHLIQDFAYLLEEDEVIDFPAWETLPSEAVAPSPDIVGERHQVLRHLSDKTTPSILICPLQAVLQKVISKSTLNHLFIDLELASELPFDTLPKRLLEMGYEHLPSATDKGQFAIRGSILDIFPISYPEPFRIEFFDDRIESMRAYDPASQKSVRKVESVKILPALEMELLQSKNSCSLLDYLGKHTLLILDDLHALEDRAVQVNPTSGSPSFTAFKEFLEETKDLQKIFLTKTPLDELTKVTIENKKYVNAYSDAAPAFKIAFSMFSKDFCAMSWKHPFESITDVLFQEALDPSESELFTALSRFSQEKIDLFILSESENDERTFQNRLKTQNIHLPPNTRYEKGYLSSGFKIKDSSTVVLPLTELTHRYKIRRQKQRCSYHAPASELLELRPGDLIVHFNNGIGKYLGIEKKPNHHGVDSEFLVIEYADKTKLYVPISHAYLISKYVGSSESLPTLHSLNNSKWKTLRTKTEGAILGYAHKLLELYADRAHNKGFAFKEDSLEMQRFEEDFPYTETEDQKAAIDLLKKQMCSEKCMDLLVCGDVGYGKTEVAMRAAFKAIVDGAKQVAVLVPTTLLAMQHYDNFLERMRNFPVRIGVLSRFRTQKQIKATLKELEEGSLDILIGTHRLISKDVVFKDLGLVIVDEEQRFGVKAKEHLKTIKRGVDCITLSATPIPRTLYMSLVGARDMAVISTPPQDRLPIKTIIADDDNQVVTTALQRELARDGQAFVIHNRVESIFDMKTRISKLLPGARILVVHGQMSADEIDTVFHAFKNGQADILIATTIIESGIDIPNANTILIDRADQFGLADLYQLRGRVGRWNRRAYCYFLKTKRRSLSEIAGKRLDALAQVSGYGGGMRLAMRDLEIRGAGDLIGTEQSGHVSSIGFHLYCKLLKRTIDSLQGKSSLIRMDTKIDFPQDARLPENYVNDPSLRMEIYQRLGDLFLLEDVDNLFKELIDRFGPLPLPAKWLYHTTRIRVIAASKNIITLKLQSMTLSIEMQAQNKVQTRTLLFSAPKDPAQFENKLLGLL